MILSRKSRGFIRRTNRYFQERKRDENFKCHYQIVSG